MAANPEAVKKAIEQWRSQWGDRANEITMQEALEITKAYAASGGDKVTYNQLQALLFGLIHLLSTGERMK